MSIDQHQQSRTVSPRSASPHQARARFAAAGEPAQVAVVIVTYNSAGDIDGLLSSLRAEARGLRLRVVVADNGSADDTRTIVARHEDVLLASTAGNLGYAAGINRAARLCGDVQAVLVLNPDLRVEPGSIAALLAAMRRTGAGIVVPRLLEEDGRHYPSLRREPHLGTALGDALFGAKFPGRPGWLAETVYDLAAYESPGSISWATGAALFIEAGLAGRLGDWDERFFLYSEEIDYFRRAREAGALIHYEPEARMRHIGGASGASVELAALLAVNRVRYMRKHAGPGQAAAFRVLVVLREALRSYRAENRRVCRYLLDESSWPGLPGPTPGQDPRSVSRDFPRGTVIIPAHNEAAVIGRTLRPLQPLAASGVIEVIVTCNGCTDGTEQVAAGFPGVRVLQVRGASKVAAMNAADAAASHWPRLYLDADIEISPSTLRLVFEHLADESHLAARPSMRYDDSAASRPVRAFYRARRRLASTDRGLWGAGAFGLSRAGHARFGRFPAVTGDDRFVDAQFSPAEKTVLATPPVTVTTPATLASLLAILRRNYRGDAELHVACAGGQFTAHQSNGSSTARTLRELAFSITGPRSLADAATYAALVTTARLARRMPGRQPRWERDESSRRPSAR